MDVSGRDRPGAPNPSPGTVSAAREALCRPLAAGEVRGFLYDQKSGKLEFNLEDDRNNLTVMIGDADAMAAELERELDGGY